MIDPPPEPAQLVRQLERERRARKSAEALLESKSLELYEASQSLKIYAEVVRCTGEAVIITDLAGTIVDVNPAYENFIGRSRDELVGTPLYGGVPTEGAEGSHGELWHVLRTCGRWTGELLDRRSNGESFPSWVLINAVRDERGEPVHYVCVARDITALKQSEEQLKRLAFYDTLTQLPNRALFNDRLGVALQGAGRRQALVAVVYLDLDRFKDVNDTLGHPAGDRLLVEISRRLETCVRAVDTVARMGGDEFTILLTDLDTEADAVGVVERILEMVGRPVALGDDTVRVGASLGLSFFPKDGQNAEALQQAADLALYQAKQGGRGQYRAFGPEMHAKGNSRLSLSVQIDAALTNDEFTLAYQPIVNLTTGQVEGVEALIRWLRPDGESIAPAQFIPHAEEAGLIKRIDSWVLERACRDAVRWQQGDNRGLRVSVNLSAVSVQQPHMARVIEDILQRTGLAPSLLSLEITETAVISNPDAVRRALDDVVRLGVGVSLDDFGTGYSSLSYLTRFPINCIKLDRTFVERIGRDPASEEVITSLLGLARKLKLKVVAEGIEDPGQQDFLSRVGCDLMQGFFFGRPMAGDQLLGWLASKRRALAEGAGFEPAVGLLT